MKHLKHHTFICLLLCAMLIIPCNATENVYRKATNASMQIALTFDDGPHPGRTPEILDILEKYGIKATFFVIGQNVEYYPDVFERTVAEGHEIGNHTYGHRVLSRLSEKEIEGEISDFNDAIDNYYAKEVNTLRPPEGSFNDSLREYANKNGTKIVLWSVDTMDWAHRTVDTIVETVLSETDGGDIILMHDYISGDSPTPEALEIIIPELLSRGFEFVTVSQLLAS